MDEVAPQIPRQMRDISYGRYGGGAAYGYFARPTPGGPNDEGDVWAEIVSKVEYSVGRGFYEGPFVVELGTTTPGTTICYTTDGSEPTEANGVIYTEPIRVEDGAVIAEFPISDKDPVIDVEQAAP